MNLYRQRYIDREQQEWLVSQATGRRCLHVGCGEKPIAVAVNIDPNPSRAAWRDFDYDVHDLPFGEASFDSVVSSHVLPSLKDIDQAMCEMIRVLKPGGHMAHVIPDWTHAPIRRSKRFPWQWQHQGWYGPEEFREFLKPYASLLQVVLCEHFPYFEFSFRVKAIKL